MSERHRALQRAASLREIDEILGAMKSLSFVEVHRINNFIQAQRQAVEIITSTAMDFLSDYHEYLQRSETTADILCLLGSERGLCGDFNSLILKKLSAHVEQFGHVRQVVVVGSHLADRYDGEGHAFLEGASVADEVPKVIARVLHEIAAAISQQAEPVGLVLIYQDEKGVQSRRLLPFSPPQAAARQHAFPLGLQLSPQDFFQGLTEHYLYGVLHLIFYESLLEENHQRLEHMQQARDRLSETLGKLERRQRKLWQEEITEEIELILLNSASEFGRNKYGE